MTSGKWLQRQSHEVQRQSSHLCRRTQDPFWRAVKERANRARFTCGASGCLSGDACVNCRLDHAMRIVASAIPHRQLLERHAVVLSVATESWRAEMYRVDAYRQNANNHLQLLQVFTGGQKVCNTCNFDAVDALTWPSTRRATGLRSVWAEPLCSDRNVG